MYNNLRFSNLFENSKNTIEVKATSYWLATISDDELETITRIAFDLKKGGFANENETKDFLTLVVLLATWEKDCNIEDLDTIQKSSAAGKFSLGLVMEKMKRDGRIVIEGERRITELNEHVKLSLTKKGVDFHDASNILNCIAEKISNGEN